MAKKSVNQEIKNSGIMIIIMKLYSNTVWHVCVWTCVCVCVRLRVRVRACVRVYMHTCVHIYVCAYVYVGASNVHGYVCPGACAYATASMSECACVRTCVRDPLHVRVHV